MTETSYDISNDFYSRKNGCQIPYRDDKELALISKFEADSGILEYEFFYMPVFDNKTRLLREESIGFVLRRAGGISYVLVSDYLAERPFFLKSLKPLLYQKAGRGAVTILKKDDISQNLNVSRIK